MLNSRRKTFSCAMITGASLGLGRALAWECASRGMRLVLVALPGSGLPELGAAIARDRGVAVDWVEGDLTEPSTIESLRALIRSKRISIDLLVNNAGIGFVGWFRDAPESEHDSIIDLNVRALVRLTRLFIGELRAKRGASILNVASMGASFPMPTLSVYAATKSFVFSFSLALREELAGTVGVSVLCPNAIRTTAAVNDYVERMGLAARLASQTPEAVARAALNGTARNRAVIVPGNFNRFLAGLGRFVPRALVLKAVRRYWGGFGAADQDAITLNGRISVLYFSGAGGTRVAAELLAERLSPKFPSRAIAIRDPQAGEAAEEGDFLVLCAPTYYLKPAPSMTDFVEGLPRFDPPRPVYVVATYELYAENAARSLALALNRRGAAVVGARTIRAPGSDVTCVLPSRLCPWLYRFEKRFPAKLKSIADEITLRIEARDFQSRVPAPKWYTPLSQLMQVLLFNRFHAIRNRMRVLPDRCTRCGACVAGCTREAMVWKGGAISHDAERCDLCTRCVHHCPQRAVVLVNALRDNPRLDERRFATLKEQAKKELCP